MLEPKKMLRVLKAPSRLNAEGRARKAWLDERLADVVASSITAMKIDKNELYTLWYEGDEGNVYAPDPADLPDAELDSFPIQVSQFPCVLQTNMYRTVLESEVEECSHPEEHVAPTGGWVDGMEGRECAVCHGSQLKKIGEPWPEEWEANGSRPLLTMESGWPEDLVLAMATSGDFTLSEAILVAAQSCERCMNVLYYKYVGAEDGYPEGSEDWEKAGTSCEFCG